MESGSTGNGINGGVPTAGKVITCKAAVAYGPGEAMSVEQILVDPPKAMEVRIKILYTSICHTDLSFWMGEMEAQRVFPRILGHEAVGVVESVGEGVEDLRPGDHVVATFSGECGHCAYCKSSKTNLCEKFRPQPFKCVMSGDGGTRFRTKDGEKAIYHFLNTSTFTEYTVMDSACAVKVDAGVNLKHMPLLSCGVPTGIGAVWNTANVEGGETVAVFGLGGVGLSVVAGARARGASRIIGVDINSQKAIKGRAMGVTDFINPMDVDRPVQEVIGEMTGGGVDYSFECTGNVEVLRQAFDSTHDGWGLTVVLGIHSSPAMLPLHPLDLFSGRRIVGCLFGGFKAKSQLPALSRLCASGGVRVEELITHELPFDQINHAFQLLLHGKSLRCLLHL